jgi:hypothetical protein
MYMIVRPEAETWRPSGTAIPSPSCVSDRNYTEEACDTVLKINHYRANRMYYCQNTVWQCLFTGVSGTGIIVIILNYQRPIPNFGITKSVKM